MKRNNLGILDTKLGHNLFNKKGTILVLIIFIIVVLAILAVGFNKLFIQVQLTSYRFEVKTLARSVAEAALEEAIAYLRKAFQSTGSDEFKWLLNKSTYEIDIPTPQIANLLSSLLRNTFSGEISVNAKIYEFRDTNSRGDKYFEKEGVGTLEIKSNVKILSKGSNKVVINLFIIRHYDFKIINLISKRDNASERKCYSPSFILDYVLFIKDAVNEFVETFGKAYNVPGVELVIDQRKLLANPSKLGKVYFGGTESLTNLSTDPDKSVVDKSYIFINICEKVDSLVPKFDKEFHRIGLDECVMLFPSLSQGKKYIKGLEGVFGAIHLPLTISNFEKNHHMKDIMSNARQALRESMLPKIQKLTSKQNIKADDLVEFEAPGIYLLSDNKTIAGVESNANYILEGAIRQRFFSFVYFYFDFSKVSKAGRDFVEKVKADKLACIPVCEKAKQDKKVYEFTVNLEKMNASRPPHIHSFISSYEDSYLYKGGQDGNSLPLNAIFNKPLPRFYTYDNQVISDYSKSGVNAEPFNSRFANLRVAAFKNFEHFKKAGFYDEKNKKLYLNGIYEIAGKVELGKGISDSIEYEGQGLIIAPSFIISSGIKKTSKPGITPICILYAKKDDIIVETSNRIEASLIAISNDFRRKIGVIAKEPLNLFGSLAADRLYLESWKTNARHTIEYDYSLKLPDDDLYKIFLSNYVSFQRIYETSKD